MIKLRNRVRYPMSVIILVAPVGLASWVAWASHLSDGAGVSNLTETARVSSLTRQSVSVATRPEFDRSEAYGRLPLSFEANQGQIDPRVRFLSHGPGYLLFLTSDEAVLALRKSDAVRSSHAADRKFAMRSAKSTASQSAVVRMSLVGADSAPKVIATDELPAKSNYLLGNDPQKWHTNISHYAKVHYEAVYPGIDLVYYGTERQLEYDFVVAPGADPSQIKFRITGTRDMRLGADGDLVMRIPDGEVRQHKPVVYQEAAGVRQEIDGQYVIKGKEEIGVQVATYDTSRPLIIDPVLVYSTYLGGSLDDFGNGIAVDGAGSAYVTGRTPSFDFPTTPGVFQPGQPGFGDVFVTKLNETGSALVYSTYLGGGGYDEGLGIAVDGAGNAYVTGRTFSSDFPTTAGGLQPGPPGIDFGDAFVTKLNRDGSALSYSTYLGGSATDVGNGIAVDGAGHAYVTGETISVDFPTTPGAFQPARAGLGDAFVTKLNRRGSALVYSTYLGAGGDRLGFDRALAIAVDGAGSAYVTGRTESVDFPTTPGAFQPAHAGGVTDGFVTKLNRRGSALAYSTFLGGSGTDEGGLGIAVDGAGHAYVIGRTFSVNFPTTSGAFQPAKAGVDDGFVTKLNRRGSALFYSTYLGGSFDDLGNGIAVDGAGNAYITGFTLSSYSFDFPTTSGAFQTANVAGAAFVAKIGSSEDDPEDDRDDLEDDR